MAGRQGHTPALTVENPTVSYAEFCQDALAFGGCASSGSSAATASRSTWRSGPERGVRGRHVARGGVFVRSTPCAEIFVVREDESACGAGEQGELPHRGALGYWNDAERTAERFRPAPGSSGALSTPPETAVWSGDMVVRDEEGSLFFVGRTDETIKTSGYRVSPTLAARASRL